MFEKMIKDAAVTFLLSFRLLKEKRRTDGRTDGQKVRAQTLFKCHSPPSREYLNTITGYAYHLLRIKEQTTRRQTGPPDHIWCRLAHNTTASLLRDDLYSENFSPSTMKGKQSTGVRTFFTVVSGVSVFTLLTEKMIVKKRAKVWFSQ